MNVRVRFRRIRTGVLGLLLASLAGCAGPEAMPTPGPADDVLRFDARVVHVPLEGGFYGLVGDDGRHYEPVGLAARFRRDGMRLHVQAQRLERASIRMWGQPVRILDVAPAR